MSKDIKLTNAHILFGDAMARLKELPDNSVDSIVTDPPYGLSDNKYVADTIVKWVNGERDFIPNGKGFMGKAWDSFVPPPAIWDECLRVLKPGGHLLAFFGSRTQDIGALSIRLAGFEIRDSIAWVYGSGFPKSLDISKAIDKNNGETDRLQRFTAFMRTTGLTAKQINEATNSNMGSHYLTDKSQPAIPTSSYWKLIRSLITIEIPQWVDQLVERIEAEREVIGKGSDYGHQEEKQIDQKYGFGAEYNITAPATEQAKQWQGWGTALKPAVEPIVVARKPLSEKTVANNVLKWGTGGLNIDASRIGTEDNLNGGAYSKGEYNTTKTVYELGTKRIENGYNQPSGRFPANIILDETTAAILDEQTAGKLSAGHWAKTKVTGYGEFGNGESSYKGVGEKADDAKLGASKFFYVAKASKKDRNEGLEGLPETLVHAVTMGKFEYATLPDGTVREANPLPRQNFHPTVKPTTLMEYLIKLATPVGGTVLDPFTGSGSTGKAALLNGFKFIGCELTEEYLPIIEGRLKFAENKYAEQQTLKEETLFDLEDNNE